ncbi:MAG: SDR family NAD(P)-dependent oxidoreductase [Clostridiales Family XIII bacterium]|jgi:NAD(P)-dependent dehydrogenase (short-subunit alcohol dehydrogenase family)|nr:SDR family NAD(P)-dependent oxidoreductase [Clostridiales Family XIII bacterium]
MSRSESSFLDGKTAIVTGYGGVGYEVALALALRGAAVVVAGRDESKGRAAVERIERELEGEDARQGLDRRFPGAAFEMLDLFDPSSTRDFAARVIASRDHVDMIFCVAGVMMPDELGLTSAGVERQFAVNYLGHYELVGRLMPLLRASDGARVVTVSSIANRPTRFDLADAVAARDYVPSISYALSKLCCLMYALELNRRFPFVRACCAHPGLARTNLFSGSKGFTMSLLRVIFFVFPFIRQSARAAARPVLYAALSPDAVGGAYYGPMFAFAGPPRRALTPLRARNERLRERMWTVSEELTGVKYE